MNEHEKIDDLFQQAREQQPQASFKETKELFLKSLGNQNTGLHTLKKGKLFTFKNSIVMSTLIGLIALLSTLFFLQDSSDEKSVETHLNQIKSKNTVTENTSIKKNQELEPKSHIHPNTKPQKATSFSLNEIQSNSFIETLKNEAGIDNYWDQEEETQGYNLGFVSKTNDEYVFPKLTEKEIEKTKKQKKKMLKALAKMDRDVYAYIPSGSFEYQGTMISVQAFFMQKTEVSNLEYRTYLFDLLINDRKEEFLKAKPNQQAWKLVLGDSAQCMIDTYFSNEIYDDFPVNNISREGAELYCKWLSKELQNYVGEDDAVKYNDMRIPTRQEWVKAASMEGVYKNYAWHSDTIFDMRFGRFNANFNLKNHHYIPNLRMRAEAEKAINYYPVAKGNTIHPSKVYTHSVNMLYSLKGSHAYNLFNLCGNVAEMVVNVPNLKVEVDKDMTSQKPKLSPGTAGGGWMNSAEEIKINSQDNHPNVIEAHPNIGFRVITTHIGRGGYNYKR